MGRRGRWRSWSKKASKRVTLQRMAAAAALALAAATGGCQSGGSDAATQAGVATKRVTITTAAGKAHDFTVELAATEAQQQRGLMYRPSIPADGGMLFAPYPPDGGPPKPASFWMKNTPSALDILFIRPDGTVATIAEDTIPYSEIPVGSGEPVSAVLELGGGRAAELGIAAGDKVTWK